MPVSVFWRDKEATTNVDFHVMTRSEIPDMASSDITTRLAEKKEEKEQLQSIKRFTQTQ